MSAWDDYVRDLVRLRAEQWTTESPFVGGTAAEEQAPIHPWYQGYTPFVKGWGEMYAPEAEEGDHPAELEDEEVAETFYELTDEASELWRAEEAESPFQHTFEQPWALTAEAKMERAEAFEDEFAFEEPGIISGDNRVRVKKTDGVPWRWICKISIKDKQDRYFTGGTGVLISHKHVLTAAHVVYPEYIDPKNYSVEVIPALNEGDEPFGAYSLSAKPKIPKNYGPKAQDHLDWDYALITLKDRVGEKAFAKLGGGPLCYWGHPTRGANTIFVRPEPRTLNWEPALTAGYPNSKGFDPRRGGTQVWCAAGMLHSADQRRRKMGITADTTLGQSGSPVWVVKNRRYCLVGIATGAGQQSNVVVRVTRELIRQLRAWITEDGETPTIIESEMELEAPAVVLSSPESEHYKPPAAEWSPEPTAEEAEDFTGSGYEEDALELLYEQPLEERFDPSAVPKDVADALGKEDWPLALKLAIQAGWRDENELTNLIFFTQHPELPPEPLDSKGPKFKQLSAAWTKILNKDVWKAIEASAENTDLVVSGKEVTDHHRRFFRGKKGKVLKKLVEDMAREVDLNPGLLGTIMMAETRRPQSYFSSGKVKSYHVGTDDFYENRAAIKARVPAYAKIKWDKNQTPDVHLNDAKKPRLVKTILFDSGPDAVLATAVDAKFREVRLREKAAGLKGDFDNLPLATRFALTRMAFAGGIDGATPFLKDALKGVDIFIRKAIPVAPRQTQRNATVRTAQAMHLSDWIFGIPVPAAVQHELETFEGFDDAEFGDDEFGKDEFEEDEFHDEAKVSSEDIDPELAEEVEHADHETEDAAPSFEMLVPKVFRPDLRTRIDEYFNLAKAAYVLPDGTRVSARPQFRYAKAGGTEMAIRRVSRILGKAFEKRHPKAIYMAAYGKAKPRDIAAITQALISAGELPAVRAAHPGVDNEQLVRALQREFKMGIDCAGYVQLAFIHAYTGSDDDPPSVRRSLGLHERRGWERLADLSSSHFTKVDVVDAQTGDLFVMKPRAGSSDRAWHTVIIVDHIVSGTVNTFLVDASWGTDLYGVAAGGVARRKLKHDTSTGEWWDVNPMSGIEAHKNTIGPYNGHPIHGVFRAKH